MLQGIPERMDILFLFNHSQSIEVTRTILSFLKFVVHSGYFESKILSVYNLNLK